MQVNTEDSLCLSNASAVNHFTRELVPYRSSGFIPAAHYFKLDAPENLEWTNFGGGILTLQIIVANES